MSVYVSWHSQESDRWGQVSEPAVAVYESFELALSAFLEDVADHTDFGPMPTCERDGEYLTATAEDCAFGIFPASLIGERGTR